jgi:hypothetical protein
MTAHGILTLQNSLSKEYGQSFGKRVNEIDQGNLFAGGASRRSSYYLILLCVAIIVINSGLI